MKDGDKLLLEWQKAKVAKLCQNMRLCVYDAVYWKKWIPEHLN